MSTIKKLLSVNVVIAITLAIGFLNNVAIAAFFGLNASVDAYFAAQMLPSLFMTLIVDYLGKNFLPVYSQRYAESPEQAYRLASTVVLLVGILATMVLALMIWFAEPIHKTILPGFDQTQIDAVLVMFYILAPVMVLRAVSAFHDYIWQHDEHFTRVMVTRIFIPGSLAIFVLAGGYLDDERALAYGFLAGHALAATFLAFRIPYKFTFRIDPFNADVKRIFTNSGLLMGSGVIARSRSLLVSYFASLLGEGAISAMAISNKVCKPIDQTALIGVRMIVFARSAKEAAQGNLAKMAELYNFAISAVLLFVTPLGVFLLLNSQPVVETLFMRGEFTPEMASLVALAMIGHSISIPFVGIIQILSNAFYAMNRIIVPLLVMPAGTIAYFFVAGPMSENFGILGLALSYTGIGAVTTVVMLFALRELLPEFGPLRALRRFAVYSLVAGVSTYLALQLAEALGLSGLISLILIGLTLGILYLSALHLGKESIYQMISRRLRGVLRGAA